MLTLPTLQEDVFSNQAYVFSMNFNPGAFGNDDGWSDIQCSRDSPYLCRISCVAEELLVAPTLSPVVDPAEEEVVKEFPPDLYGALVGVLLFLMFASVVSLRRKTQALRRQRSDNLFEETLTTSKDMSFQERKL